MKRLTLALCSLLLVVAVVWRDGRGLAAGSQPSTGAGEPASSGGRLRFPPGPALMLSSVDTALGWLNGHQNPDGSWGSGATLFRDTTFTVDALAILGQSDEAIAHGLAYLHNASPPDNDALARLVRSMARSGVDVTVPVNALLANQNSSWRDSGIPNEPEGGWGLAAGYASDSLDTALALDALHAAGLPGGLSVVGQTVTAGSYVTHTYTLPAGATSLSVLFNPLAGRIHVRHRVGAPPTPADPYYDLSGPAYLSGLPLTPGQHFLRVDGVDPTSTYSLQVSYVANGFDTASLQTPVDYLLTAQNGDGGWGWTVEDTDSNLVVTAHVLATLSAYAAYYDLGPAEDDGAQWLVSQQHADGGWGVAGSSVVETSLVYHVLHQLTVAPADSPVSGIDYLLASQQANGSWNDRPYDTAAAALALAPYIASSPAVALLLSGPDIVLSWVDSPLNNDYEVHRSLLPYFTPSAATRLATLPAGATGYVDAGAAAAAAAYFYQVVGVNSIGQTADSNAVGKFTFTLTPGE